MFKVLVEFSPQRLKKHILIKKFNKNNIWYAIFEGEKDKKWLKYGVNIDVMYAKDETHKSSTQNWPRNWRNKLLVFEKTYPRRVMTSS